LNTEFIILFTLFHFPLPNNNHVMHVRQDQRKRSIKRNARQERDTAAGKPGRLRPKIQASKKRAHPNTEPRKSARRNRGKYPETRNRLKKSLPHRQSHSTHQPPGLSPDKPLAYLFIKRKMVKEEENGTCIL